VVGPRRLGKICRDERRWPENSERERMTDRGRRSGELQGKAFGEEARAAVGDTERVQTRGKRRGKEKKKKGKIRYKIQWCRICV